MDRLFQNHLVLAFVINIPPCPVFSRNNCLECLIGEFDSLFQAFALLGQFFLYVSTLLFRTTKISFIIRVAALTEVRHTCFISFSCLLFNSVVLVFLSFVFFIRLVANLFPKYYLLSLLLDIFRLS